jgi:hypothetical protein
LFKRGRRENEGKGESTRYIVSIWGNITVNPFVQLICAPKGVFFLMNLRAPYRFPVVKHERFELR